MKYRFPWPIAYLAGAIAGALAFACICAGTVTLFGFDSEGVIEWGAFAGIIYGLSTVRESRRPEPLVKKWMREMEE